MWCYVANEPFMKVREAFDLDFRSTSTRGVKVDLNEVHVTPPVTQIQYWLTRDPPQAAAAPTPASTPRPVRWCSMDSETERYWPVRRQSGSRNGATQLPSAWATRRQPTRQPILKPGAFSEIGS